jgi:predicted regulator of Ras-like GTPase activity (Roadblock/LC7/MglB family)
MNEMTSLSTLTTPLLQPARQTAQALFAEVDGARAVVIATADGFDLAHAGHQTIDPARLAAMVSSVSALGDAASRETGIGTPRYLVIESSEGRLVVRCMQVQQQALVAVVLTDKSVTLGLVLSHLSQAEQLMNAA